MNFLMAALPIVGEWVGKIIDAVAKYRQGQIDIEALKKTSNDATDAMVAKLANIPEDAAATNAVVDAIGEGRFPDEPTPVTAPPAVIIPDAPAEPLPIVDFAGVVEILDTWSPADRARLAAMLAGSER